MPGWSTEVANEFIRWAAENGRRFDQMQLQHLVYIAHGWCLALTGEPLTGDRPEAWDFGPVYRRLADALAPYGLDPVTRLIEVELSLAPAKSQSDPASGSDFEPTESEIIARVAQDYGGLSAAQLSAFTTADDSPWRTVYSGGAGQFRDVPHALIGDQFRRLLESAASSASDDGG